MFAESKKKVEHLDQKATDNRERAYELMSARLGFAYLHVVEPEIAKGKLYFSRPYKPQLSVYM